MTRKMNPGITLLLIALFIADSTAAQSPLVKGVLNAFSGDSVNHYVLQLSGERTVVVNGVSDTIKSRQVQNPDNELAFQFMKNHFKRHGYQVDSLQFATLGKNLFAIKPGYLFPEKRFMLGAHYDNLPGAWMAPGADDNASGTAAVLEAARVFRNFNFPFTIIFALWDEEEPGLVGSNAYVTSQMAKTGTLLGYINVDMLGWDGNNDMVGNINTKSVANSILLANRAAAINTTYSIGLQIHIVNPGSEATDHAPFWGAGLTAIGINEEYHSDFNPFWHTTSDSLSKFNLTYYHRMVKFAMATLAHECLDTLNTVGLAAHDLQSVPIAFYNSQANTIEHKCNCGSPYRVQLISSSGNVIFERETALDTNETTEVSTLSSGVYVFLLQCQGIVYIKKFLIHHN